YGLRDDQLSVDGTDADPFQSGYTQHQLSGGIGGPLIRNRLFFFGSFQARARDDDMQSLLVASPETLDRLGTAPDSAARFQSILTGLGVPVTSYNTPTRNSDALSGLARLDWLVTDAHTLTLRGDWRDNTTDPSRVNPLALPQTGGEQLSSGGGGLLSLTSRFGTALLNEAKAYYSVSDGAGSPFTAAPQGRVQVISALEDGSQGVSSLVFGGNPGLPTDNNSKTLEITNEVSWLSPRNGHRPKLGVLFNRTTTTQSSAPNRYGTFTYNSLADLEAGIPATFSRTLVPTEREGQATNGAVYLADTWRVSPALQLTWGGRLEYSVGSGSQGYSAAVDSLFGRRTDALPEELHFSPRVGFNWTIGGGGATGGPGGGPGGFGGFAARGTTIRGGIGEFRATISPQLLASAQGTTGLSPTEFQLSCIGAGVPVPDWEAMYGDPAAIPINCTTGGVITPNRSPTVTTFNPDFGAPRSWRANLGAQKRIGFANLTADFSYARGVRQTGSSDLNLDAVAEFTLANEGNRPVYVPAAGIVPQTGAVDFLQSRRERQFGQVLSVDADLVSESFQLALSAGGITSGGVLYNASYTMARSQDQTSFGGGFGGFGGGGSTTAGDPNRRQWGTSDLDRRHTIVLTGTVPIGKAFEVTTVGRVVSGAPYTPRVGSDINGDGSRNDRAFIFSPAGAPDSGVANGMTRLLAGASGGAKSCLEGQTGAIAGRNSCRGPWQPTVDFQFNWRPDFAGLRQKLMVSLVTVNFLGGVDRLVHGSDDLRGWGQTVRPDPTLLYVTGFEQETRQFKYAVNERFGSTRNSATAVVAPFQLGLQVRYTLGPDRQREMIQAVRGAGRAGAAPGAGGGPGGG
ncbi:MAG TPA: TonB-dependent receptor, partial [Gemmatimonadales bacterium]